MKLDFWNKEKSEDGPEGPRFCKKCGTELPSDDKPKLCLNCRTARLEKNKKDFLYF